MRKKLRLNRIILFVLLWMISLWQVVAQDVQIQGNVKDSTTNEALPGVNVVIKGTTKGITTGADGAYQISAPMGSILVFSYLSYKTHEVRVEGATNINVVLQPDVEKLQEIVVIGYGSVKKSDATGSVLAIGATDFNKGAITSPQDLLVGKTAGVVITSGGGAPGSTSTIRIRGGSSLSASNDPLIVIDGVPVDNLTKSDGTSSVAGMANPLASINPNDIESFTVLKDASATAIYGSRASNGVILITTKKGSNKLKVMYNGSISVNTVPKTIDIFSASEFRNLINQRYPGTTGNDSIAKSLLGNASTDWQKEIYQNAFSHDHNLSVAGSIKKMMPYRVSVGYTNQDGILKTDNLERTTAALNLNPVLLNNHLNLNINVKGIYLKSRFANTGAIGNAVSFDPTQPVKDNSTNEYGYFAWLNGTALNNQATANPVAQLELTNDRGNVKRSIGNAQADYKFHFLPELHLNVNAGYDYSITDGKNFTPAHTSWTPNFGGNKETYSQNKDMELLDVYLNYEKTLENISSNINVMAGHSYQHFYKKDKDYKTNVGEDKIIANTYTKSQSYLESYFGRLNYTLKDRYLLTLTVREDISSHFAANNRKGIFPSVAFAWKINKESFLINNTSVSELKLRLGYGSTGQQDAGPKGDYPYLGLYTYATPDQTAYYQFGNTFYPTLRPEGYDSKLKWETTNTFNVGFDFGFLNNKITGTIDYYSRKTNDLLNKIAVPAGTNLTNYILTNVGDMENKGIEFTINAKIISTKDLYWEIGYNVSFNKNEITKLTLTNDPTYAGSQPLYGVISGGVGNNVLINSVGYSTNSFYVYQQVYDNKGNPVEGLFVDRNVDGVINSSDLYRYKKPAPDVNMGISSKLSYKNIDFSFSGRANIGNYVYNNTASSRATYTNAFNSGQLFLSNLSTQVNDSKFVNPQYFSDYYVENASFFRMDYISLGYNFNQILSGKANIRLSLTLQNAFIITKYKGLDPEVNNGLDNNIYPRPRTFLLGLNIEL